MFDEAVIDGVCAIAILSFMFFVVVSTLIFPFVNITRSDMELCSLFFVAVGVLTFFTILCSRWCGCWAWSFLRSVLSFGSHREEFGWILRGRDHREDP